MLATVIIIVAVPWISYPVSKNQKRAEGNGENAAMNTFNSSAKNSANIIAQQLLLNMVNMVQAILTNVYVVISWKSST